MSIVWKLIEFAADLFAPQFLDRRRTRFTAHVAAFHGDEQPAIFLTLTNLSRDRDIEITHVWLDTTPPVAAMRPERPLPKRLKPDEIWETWILSQDIPGGLSPEVYADARARLSTGRELRAKENKDVPPIGVVPGTQ